MMFPCRRSSRAPGLLPSSHRACRAVVLGAALLGLLVGGVMQPPAAFADPAEARKHFEMGKRYFQVDEYRKAIEEFKAAHILEPDPAFLYNIAECYRRLGEPQEALTFYRRFLSLAPSDSPTRSTAEKRVAEMEKAAQATPPAAPAKPAPAGSQPAGPSGPAGPAGVGIAPGSLTPGPSSSPGALAPAPNGAPPSSSASGASPHLLAGAASNPAASTRSAEPGAATAADEPRPFYRRPWFYVAVGAVVVAAAAGAWALSSSGGTEIPPTPLGNASVFGK